MTTLTTYTRWHEAAQAAGFEVQTPDSGHEGMHVNDPFLPTYAWSPGAIQGAPDAKERVWMDALTGHYQQNPDGSIEAILFDNPNDYFVWININQGGPIFKEEIQTVDSYFTARFPGQPLNEDVEDCAGYTSICGEESMLITTECGRDCKRAIDSAVAFIDCLKAAYPEGALEIREIEMSCHYVCCVYVNG